MDEMNVRCAVCRATEGLRLIQREIALGGFYWLCPRHYNPMIEEPMDYSPIRPKVPAEVEDELWRIVKHDDDYSSEVAQRCLRLLREHTDPLPHPLDAPVEGKDG